MLNREELANAAELNFTRRYEDGWENTDHRVELGYQAADALPYGVRDLPRRNAA